MRQVYRNLSVTGLFSRYRMLSDTSRFKRFQRFQCFQRLLLATLFFVMACGVLSASDIDPKPFAKFPKTLSGEYVVYRDYTWEKPTWIGFLYYDDSTYGAFCVTPDTKSTVSVLFRTEIVDGKLILTGQNIISQITQTDVLAVNYLMGLLPELYGYRQTALSEGVTVNEAAAGEPVRSPLLPARVNQKMTRVEFGGEVTVVYAAEIPLFNVQSIVSSTKKPVLELARIGRIQSGDDASFFGFSPVSGKQHVSTFAIPSTRKKETKLVDGISLFLDNQWTMVADNTFFLADTAILIVDTADFSSLNVSPDLLPLSLVRLFSFSNKTSSSIPSEMKISGTLKKFRVDNLFYDSVTGTANRDIKICIPIADGTCSIVSLSVSEGAYLKNRAYFDSLY